MVIEIMILQKKKYKALIIGDSFVDGIGTSDYPIDKNLEKLMNCKDCIINIGRSGNDIVNELDFLKKAISRKCNG